MRPELATAIERTRRTPRTGDAPVNIRWFIRRDLAEAMAIELESFTQPWSEDDFISALQQRTVMGMVAELPDKQIAGYMIYDLLKDRLHLINFAVAHWVRRQGVGTQMVKTLVNKLSPQRRKRIYLEIRESNLPAQLFFRDMGFRAVAVLRDHYEETDEAAYRFVYRLRKG